MTGYGAVPQGTDLGTHARALQRIHDAVLSGDRPPELPRSLVARSWARVLESGLAGDGDNQRTQVGDAELAQRRRDSPLGQVIEELRDVLASIAEASHFLMVVCDADGIILWREGAPRVKRQADVLGFVDGALWTERVVGTNAIGTALAEAAPVQLFSAEHFENKQHPWYCTASPVHDPRSGELLGVVDVSGPALTLHPAIAALVESAVRLAESRLWRLHRERLDRMRRLAEPALVGLNGPLLVVDDHGWVAHHAGVPGRDRIETPAAHRALMLPGLGLAVPERLGDGWLIRPRVDRSPIELRLDLSADPVLTLASGGDPWQAPVTRRHAQILQLIGESGAAGRTGEQLSVALYGDREHLVTVRAEVSRLRRVVGALITSSPYRLADGVALTIEPGSGPR